MIRAYALQAYQWRRGTRSANSVSSLATQSSLGNALLTQPSFSLGKRLRVAVGEWVSSIPTGISPKWESVVWTRSSPTFFDAPSPLACSHQRSLNNWVNSLSPLIHEILAVANVQNMWSYYFNIRELCCSNWKRWNILLNVPFFVR